MATSIGHAYRNGMLVAAMISAACTSGPAGPATEDGLYRMTWTLGQNELHEDLLLLPDGSFVWGSSCCLFNGMLGSRLRSGTWSGGDGQIELVLDGGAEVPGAFDGDSLTLDCVSGVICGSGFHRMQTPAAWTGTYVLASVNGRSDRILEECPELPETECQQSTHADTISVLHGAFVRRGRNESTQTYGLYSTFAGSISVGPEAWVLWHFGLPSYPSGTVSVVDTLWISDGGLARRRYGSSGEVVFEEEYVTLEGRIPGDP